MSVKMPLTCRVVKGVLTITINADTVQFATDNHPGYWDGETGEQMCKVADKNVWLQSVVERINHEEEDGSTFLTKMMDAAIADAIEQGEEGLEFEP
jgi:hypothetical protein